MRAIPRMCTAAIVLAIACDRPPSNRSGTQRTAAAGCYVLAWAPDTAARSPGLHADSIYLDTARRHAAGLGPESLNYALEPANPSVQPVPETGADSNWAWQLPYRWWTPVGPDSVSLAMVGDGAEIAWAFRLRVWPDSLRGTAVFTTDVLGDSFATMVRARRFACIPGSRGAT